MKPSDLKKMAEQMIANGEMPSLDELLDAVHDARKKYVPKIKAARKAKRRNMLIRDAYLRAKQLEKGPFNLGGRGHEPRVTLDRKMAAILRGLDLPRIYISGYGANFYYPERLVRRAEEFLKETSKLAEEQREKEEWEAEREASQQKFGPMPGWIN